MNLRQLTITLSFFCLLFSSVDGFSQQLNWASKIGGAGNENSNTVYTDPAGNVYIAGKFEGNNVDFDPSGATFLLSSAGMGDGFVAKYTSTGQFLWAFRFGGADRDEANALAFDQSNNVYVTGFFRGSNVDFDPGAGVANLNSNGQSGSDPGYGGDVVVAKYNASGQYQWAFNVGGSQYENAISIATDPSGNVYVGGYFRSGNVDFDPGAGTTMLNSAAGAMFLAKYTTTGAFQWAINTGQGNADNSVFDLKTDNAGNLYATGFFQGTNIDFDPGAGVGALSSAGGFEMYVAKYNSNGQYQFAFKVGGTGLDIGRGLTLDNAGNIYVVGDFNGANIDFDPGAGTALLSSNGGSDVFLAKYNNIGQYQWAFNFGGSASDIGWKITNDGSHLFVTGGFTGTSDMNPSAVVDNLVSAGGNDIFLGKYTLRGEYVCAFKIGGTGNDYGYSIASNVNNVFYLSGSFSGTNVDFDPTAATSNLSSASGDDVFLAKYTWPDNITSSSGTLAGSTICMGGPAQLTFTATAGTGPFTIVYNNGSTNVTQANVQSGVPFTVTPAPTVTTTYTLVSVKDAQLCSEPNAVSGITAVVTVNACTSLPCNNWLNTPSQPSWVNAGDIDVPGNQLTVEALINIKGIPPGPGGNINGEDVVSKHTSFNNANYLLRSTHAEMSTTNGFFATPVGCDIEMNKTYHVAMVYDGVTLKYYRNGFLLGQVPATGNMIQNDFPTGIGFISTLVQPENLIGYINEVRIWSVARTQAEIRANMSISLSNPATQTGLKAYYTFDNLLNKQGNAAYNGSLQGSAAINTTNPDCTFTPDSCRTTTPPVVTAGFTATATACVNDPITITNTSQNATSYYWSFCAADPTVVPTAVNLGNPGNSLSAPVFSDIVSENGNYYVFVTSNWPGKLTRLDFGNSLLNTPTAVNLGNLGGVLVNTLEGIQVVRNEGKWYAIIVGGSQVGAGIPARVIKVEFGANITNTTPIATNWGNIGNMAYPTDIHLFKEGDIWYGLTINSENNTITRFNFTSSFTNTPTAVNLGGFGMLNFPTGIYAVNNSGNWYVFITNDNDNPDLIRLNFGNSLLNTPTATNLGNPGGVLRKTRDIYILKECDRINAFAVNGAGVSQLIKLDFGNDILSVPTGTNLGNIGDMNFPHSISKMFRVGNDLYTFVTNVDNNTVTRIRFAGCTSSSIPNSSVQNPAPVTYSTPGTYNITLTIDDGLPTQATVCQQVVVTACAPVVINQYTEVLAFDACKNRLTVSDATSFNAGDTVLMIQMKGAVIDSTNTAAFGTITDNKNAGNYEFNYVKAKNGNTLDLLNVAKRQYDIPDGKVQLVRVPYFQDYTVTAELTAAPWDGSKGGVLAFNVQNSLTLNAGIDVSGKGFRGGTAITHPQFTCNIDSFYSLINDGRNAARKGEGIFNTTRLINGRGKLANGGGGGNSTNAGGAGGGNGGAGGAGGKQYISCSDMVNGGVGGLSLPYSNASNRIFLGGGGGAGQENDIPALGSGGNGGGIAIISCGNLSANGFSITANGETPVHLTGSNDDGRSGGGAGGTILLNYTTSSGAIAASVKGGNGDYCTPPSGLGTHGPGGGGGGGLIWVNKPMLGSNFTVDLDGGINGTNTNLSNNPWGASAGSRGDTLKNLVIPVADVLFKPNIDSVRIRKRAISCSQFDFEGLGYVNITPVASWQWYFDGTPGPGTQNTSHTFTVDGTHDVKLVITDANGCKDSITTQIEAASLSFDFSYSRDVCDPMTVQFNGIGSGTGNSYWNFGDGNSITGVTTTSHAYATTGNYVVKYSITNGVCTDTVRKTISVDLEQDNNLILTQDTTICYNTTKQLRTSPVLDFCWSPVTYLDNPDSPQPVTSATQDITYYFTAQVTGANLITNGDFTQGNTGFMSAYTHTTPNTTEGQYFIGTNPRAWNGGMSACGDHTTGTGNMMMVNGAPVAGANVWSQSITVTPNTNYAFSTWVESVVNVNPAQLQFSINGKDISTLITASLPACTWVQFYTTWNSGNSTTALISIVNKNTILAGNDFALDDISFAPVFIKRDSVKITVEKPLVKTNNDTTVCAKGPVQLVAAGAQTYSWSPATGLTDPGIGNPVASPADTTRYIVTGTSVNGCVSRDTVYVNVFAKPDIVTSDDATICKNTSVPLSVSGGSSYNWFPSATLSNPGSSNPVASPVTDMTYYVTVTDIHDCSYLDSVKIAIRPAAVFTVNGAGSVCVKDSLQLTASGGNIYAWQPTLGLSSSSAANPKASPPVTTDYTVTITETSCGQSATLPPVRVTVLPLPAVQASRSNDIDCTNDRSQLNATGASRYVWTPSASLSSSVVAGPVATPVSTTQYVVAGTSAAGCTNYDTVIVKVENINKGAYLMPNAFTPNNDGLNDCYGISSWGIISELEFSIYNRWGERIFFTKNPGQCWDGTYKGVKQNSDVFVYMIKAKTNCESSVFRKGTFVLIR